MKTTEKLQVHKAKSGIYNVFEHGRFYYIPGISDVLSKIDLSKDPTITITYESKKPEIKRGQIWKANNLSISILITHYDDINQHYQAIVIDTNHSQNMGLPTSGNSNYLQTSYTLLEDRKIQIVKS